MFKWMIKYKIHYSLFLKIIFIKISKNGVDISSFDSDQAINNE